MIPPPRPGHRLVGYHPAPQGKGQPFKLVGQYEPTKQPRAAAATLTHDPDGLYEQAGATPRAAKRGLLL
jgi:hypothetical protein